MRDLDMATSALMCVLSFDDDVFVCWYFLSTNLYWLAHQWARRCAWPTEAGHCAQVPGTVMLLALLLCSTLSLLSRL
ncbi:unnamed protein product [Musa acuminata subsp. malaccensis]|uniref:(wild Malaysian banana) hypothetical protein n=1 Tax=Musa acuminata subsp. malaccensis TaxID=214687 RepID=A0A804IB36_MUSAM|nr:unnamed protein product [Musa acuminata subsp. malaccensis]